MRLIKPTRFAVALAAAALLASACGGAAQPTQSPSGIRASDYPTKAISIMAPANPGGGFDTTARLIQKALVDEKIVTVPVSVTNKPGAGGTVGMAELIKNSKGDPYSLIVVGRVALGSQITSKTEAKVSQLTPIARLMAEAEVIVTPANSPYAAMKDLMDALKRDAKAVKFGGGSAGGADHELAARLVKEATGSIAGLAYVPFAGGGEAAAAIIGGQVQVGISGYGEFKGHIAGGQMKALAVSSEKQLEGVNIPTLPSAGVNITLENWRLLAAPPEIAQPELLKLRELAQKVHDSRTWLDFAKTNNWRDNFTTEGLITYVATETSTLTATLTELGLVK
jgi:putative tricarboxylic transport membrane protein